MGDNLSEEHRKQNNFPTYSKTAIIELCKAKRGEHLSINLPVIPDCGFADSPIVFRGGGWIFKDIKV